MTATTPTTASPRPGISPFFALLCGLVLMLGGAAVYWLEPAPVSKVAAEKAAAEVAEAAAARALERARKREAAERAEMQRLAAEEAAERARRIALQADAAAEAEARRQREELAQRQAAAEQARRAAADAEEAWKRFYRPSERCRSPEGATSVECVNEYVKARREFASRAVASGH